MSELKGLRLDVYRHGTHDASCGGISATHKRLTLVGTINRQGQITPAPKGSAVFSPSDDAPAVVLGRTGDTVHITALDADGKPDPNMYGGNFAHTSDSRLGDFIAQAGVEPFYGAISIHDRNETRPLAQPRSTS